MEVGGVAKIKRRGLGRRFSPDARDQGFLLRAVMPKRIVPRARYYKVGRILDQGATSQCVAFAWKQWLDSAPIMTKEAKPPSPKFLYDQAQMIDEWHAEPHEGTSVRAGAKVLETIPKIGAYHWAFTIADVRDYIIATGTVVLGTNWYDGMFEPAKSGFVKLTGGIAGGHAYLAIGYSVRKGAFRFVNSWSAAWGQGGRFWMAGEDLERLLNEDGEACAGVEIAG